MRETAIRAEGLSKQFRISHKLETYRTLRDTLADTFAGPFRRAARVLRGQAATQSGKEELFWALQGVSFEIKHGELVGVIGKNGSGKSTLLKILSRITQPTSGFAEIHGRVGALLEVGTGFHAELTGRENIFLNGAILGMKRDEIRAKFDEIVAFSEVEKFIDTPVKHYSSGMYLRLAFAVAAHLEPEILIVDEVLAVGDASFQKKCLDKMRDVGRDGRTVVFVSHNLPAITRLCRRAILLDEGKVVQEGLAHQVVGHYLSSGQSKRSLREWPDLSRAPGNEIVRMCAVRLRTEEGEIPDVVDIRKKIGIEIEYEVLTPGQVLVPNFGFINEDDICVFVTQDSDAAWRKRPRPTGRVVSTAWIPGNFLSEGMLKVGAGIVTEDPFIVHCDEYPAIAFQVIDSLDGDSARGGYAGNMPGVVRPLLSWTTVEYGQDPITTSANKEGVTHV